MGFTYEQRGCDSPFVRTVWYAENQSDGVYVASADGSWDIIISRCGGRKEIRVGGPTSRANKVEYQAGTRVLGIRFRVGTFISGLRATTLPDTSLVLPAASDRAFWLRGAAWEFPDYENVEEFVARLARRNLLASDEVVDAALRGKRVGLSARSVQRHFLRTTGLTQSYIRQIERALRATDLLRRGVPIPSVVYETGYADQSHLTRSLKHLIGFTPAQVANNGTR